MPCRVARLFGATLLLTFATAAAAQDVSSEPPAHVSYVDGGAVLERKARADASPENMPILAGDRVRTEAGRVEILFVDGSTLHLDATHHRRLPIRRARAPARRTRSNLHSRTGPTGQLPIDAPAASVNIDRPAIIGCPLLLYRLGAGGRAAGPAGARLNSSTTRGARRFALASVPPLAATPPRPMPMPSTRHRGTRSIAGPRRAGTSGLRSRPSTFPRRCARTRRPSRVRATGDTSPLRVRVVSGGVDGWRPLPETGAGSAFVPTDGRGSARRCGTGRLTTMDAGGSRPVPGSGFRGEAGLLPGCRGRTRPDMSAGARSAGTIAQLDSS